MPKCNKCSTHIDPISFHCMCEDLAEFRCILCDSTRIVSIRTPPSCHTCQQPMVERGHRGRGVDAYQEPDIEVPLQLEGVDEEMVAAWAGWEKYISSPPEERMELTHKQQRRVQWYDRLIWKIDHDQEPKPEKETFHR